MRLIARRASVSIMALLVAAMTGNLRDVSRPVPAPVSKTPSTGRAPAHAGRDWALRLRGRLHRRLTGRIQAPEYGEPCVSRKLGVQDPCQARLLLYSLPFQPQVNADQGTPQLPGTHTKTTLLRVLLGPDRPNKSIQVLQDSATIVVVKLHIDPALGQQLCLGRANPL